MGATVLQNMLNQLRGVAQAEAVRDLGDAELLRRFTAGGEEVAFALLVQRHGPMVLGVCRRILHNRADAEDAFQATFLVLAKRAASIRRHASLASWLHGVARRVALRVKAQAACRRGHERRSADMARGEAADTTTWDELRRVLDEEIGGLPEKYRTPLVLCYLEGKSQAEAADDLGLARSTLGGRLERARELLRDRLARRGVALGAAALAAALAEQGAPAAVPALLTITTVRAAGLALAGRAIAGAVPAHVLTIAEEVLRTMSISKLKLMAAGLIAVGLLTVGVANFGARAQDAGTNRVPGNNPFGQVGAKLPANADLEKQRLEDLMRRLEKALREQKQAEETAKLIEQLTKALHAEQERLKDRAGKEHAERRAAAYLQIAKAITDLKKTTHEDRERKALDNFDAAFLKLRAELDNRNTASGNFSPDSRWIDYVRDVQKNNDDKLASSSWATKSAIAEHEKAIIAVRFTNKNTAPARGQAVVADVTKDKLIRFTFGNADGIAAGQTLYMIRLQPEAKYLGTAKVLVVRGDAGVASIVQAPAGESVRAGDVLLAEIGNERPPEPKAKATK